MPVDAWRELAQKRAEPLLASQNADGSWPYRSGVGLNETTCYALLARRALGARENDVARSLDWLATLRRDDGGFAPQSAVTMSNWTTALAALTFGAYGRAEMHKSAVEWLLGKAGAESAWLPRNIRNLLRVKTAYPQEHHGWPWVEGTNAWLMPTALGLLALLHASRSIADSRVAERIGEAQLMIRDRRCSDGGWNHGAPAALEVDANSYPETTGVALLAMQKVPAKDIPGADDLALRMLSQSRYAAGASWLQLGLNARNVRFETGEETAIECRNQLDSALRVLALCALGGNNIFKA